MERSGTTARRRHVRRPTATPPSAIARGVTNAQRALAAGRFRVRGDIERVRWRAPAVLGCARRRVRRRPRRRRPTGSLGSMACPAAVPAPTDVGRGDTGRAPALGHPPLGRRRRARGRSRRCARRLRGRAREPRRRVPARARAPPVARRAVVGVRAHPRRARSRPSPRTKPCGCSTRTAPRTGSPRRCRCSTRTTSSPSSAGRMPSTRPSPNVRIFRWSRSASRAPIPTPALRRRMTERSVRVVDPWDPVLERVACLLVPAAAIGPDARARPGGRRRAARRPRPDRTRRVAARRRRPRAAGAALRPCGRRDLERDAATIDDVRRGLRARTVRPHRGTTRRGAGRRCGDACRLPGRPRTAAPARYVAVDAASEPTDRADRGRRVRPVDDVPRVRTEMRPSTRTTAVRLRLARLVLRRAVLSARFRRR